MSDENRKRADRLDAARDHYEGLIAAKLDELEIAADGCGRPLDPAVRIYCESAAEIIYKEIFESLVERIIDANVQLDAWRRNTEQHHLSMLAILNGQ